MAYRSNQGGIKGRWERKKATTEPREREDQRERERDHKMSTSNQLSLSPFSFFHRLERSASHERNPPTCAIERYPSISFQKKQSVVEGDCLFSSSSSSSTSHLSLDSPDHQPMSAFNQHSIPFCLSSPHPRYPQMTLPIIICSPFLLLSFLHPPSFIATSSSKTPLSITHAYTPPCSASLLHSLRLF